MANPVRKRLLFIDRDGTMIKEAPPTYQIDSFDKLEFYPEVFQFLGRIANELDYELGKKHLPINDALKQALEKVLFKAWYSGFNDDQQIA